ncbi:MAG: hypothetical protein ACI9MC_003163 [Kiritimatiellia bacterium]|jgi:hypothetical protein
MRLLCFTLLLTPIFGCTGVECTTSPSVIVTVRHGGSQVVEADVVVEQDGEQRPCEAVDGTFHCGWEFEGQVTVKVVVDGVGETEQALTLPSCEGPTQRLNTEV